MSSSILSSINNSNISDQRKKIAEKALSGKRITIEEGVTLFKKGELSLLGAIANELRVKRHGAYTYFNRNFHIEPTNICVFDCQFCSYSKCVVY